MDTDGPGNGGSHSENAGGNDAAPDSGFRSEDRDSAPAHSDAVVIPVEFGTCRHPASSPAGFEDLVIELTPRQRRFVEVAAWTLADDVFGAIEELTRIPNAASQGISVLSDFPPCTWIQSVSWWRQQARCFDDLAVDTATATDPEPRCTGGEMALHLILQRARALATDPSDVRTDLIDGIAEHTSDGDWDGPLNFLFQDHDVLMLFDSNIEPHSSTVNLDPAQWFIPFADSPPRSHTRGFRR